MLATDRAGTDQAELPTFRVLLGVQVLATAVFGLAPLLLPTVFADITGYAGDDTIVYRLAGAATTGYLIAAIVALASRTPWVDLRIPMVATFTFTSIAALASLGTVLAGDQRWVVIVVFLAATAFAVFAAYWLRRDEGPTATPGRALTTGSKVIVGLATLSAGLFGLMPLLAPGPFATLFGLLGTDTWVFRMAGAACFGYATSGVLSLRAEGYERFAVQNMAAIAFNALAAVSAWKAVIGGDGGWLAPIVGLAATFFAITLTWLAIRMR